MLCGHDADKHASTPSLIIYRLGRNTMIHGFRGRGVFITEGIAEWTMAEGAIVINPYWLWRHLPQHLRRFVEAALC